MVRAHYNFMWHWPTSEDFRGQCDRLQVDRWNRKLSDGRARREDGLCRQTQRDSRGGRVREDGSSAARARPRRRLPCRRWPQAARALANGIKPCHHAAREKEAPAAQALARALPPR